MNPIILEAIENEPSGFRGFTVYQDGRDMATFETLKEAANYLYENMRSDNVPWDITFETEDLYIDLDSKDWLDLIDY